MLGFTHSHSGVLGDVEGFIQLITRTYKSDEPNNNTGFDKFHSKCDCIIGSIGIGIRETILYSFLLSSPRGHKVSKNPRIKLFKEINKPVLSHITIYLEVDDHKPVDFNGQTINFTCQLIKK